jgi:hypothetical protein
MRSDDGMAAGDKTGDTAPASPHVQAPGAGTSAGWSLLFAGILGGGAAGFGAAQLALQPVHEALAARPAIVVQDMGAAILRVSADDVALVIGEQQRLARRLGEAGALVLDADAVLAAPTALYVNRRAGAGASSDAFANGLDGQQTDPSRGTPPTRGLNEFMQGVVPGGPR